MVIRGGENISCIEVETAIYAHPSVQEAAVFGIPEERLGETLCVAICLKPSMELSEQELRDFLQDKLAAFKIPSLCKLHMRNFQELLQVNSLRHNCATFLFLLSKINLNRINSYRI